MAPGTWLVTFCFGGAAQLTQARVAQLIQSAGGTADRLTEKGVLNLGPDFEFEGPVVNLSRTLDQTIEGFGGAFTEAAALVFSSMPAAQRHQILEMYFGETGIGYTMGRTHINSCDFSPENYAFNNVDGDFDLEHFDTGVTHDTQTMIPLVKAAQEVLHKSGKQLKVLAAPWSPPAWMKTNGKMDGSGRPGLKETCKEVWAKYFSKWISAYKEQGIEIWAVTPQNEPENVARWEACVYTPQQEMAFIAEQLGPVLKVDHPEVKILVFDHNKDHVLKWAEALHDNATAAEQFAHGVAFHWYTGDQFNNVAKIHERYPKKLLIASEATYERWRWAPGTTMKDGDWGFGLGYAHDILNDLNAGASAWFDWNLILDQHGGPNHVDNVCDAAMIGNGTELYIHPQYYGIGHFSKYIYVGSKRLETTVVGSTRYDGPTRDYGTCNDQDGLEATAFQRPDGLLVVVVLNCGNAAIDFKLQDGDSALKTTIPAQGMQTYLLDADELSEIIA